MADRYLLESGAPDGYLLEDGSGVLLLEGTADLSLGLSGVSSASAVGSLVVAVSLALSGLAASPAVGSVGVASDIAVSGVPATGEVGSTGVEFSLPITGTEATGSVGTVVPSVSTDVAITGVSGSGAVGGVTYGLALSMPGVSAAGAVGTVTYDGGFDVPSIIVTPSPATSGLPIRIVVGSSRVDLFVSLVDPATGAGYDLRGGAARMQGRSPSLPALPFDVAMTLLDPENGLVGIDSLGSLRTQTQLNDAGVSSAIYALRVRSEDSADLVDYSPLFEIEFVANPLGV